MTCGLFDLTGQTALVTGASRGMGLAMALAMAECGAQVVISSNDPESCAHAVAESGRKGPALRSLHCDVSSRESLLSLAQDAIGLLGRIDVLCCNAGAAPHMGPIATATDADWEHTMNVNLRSMLTLTAVVIPGMAKRRAGAVVLTSSLAGLRGNRSLGLYALAKAGCAQLARNLAVEWGPQNVRVNAISPGLIDTEFARPLTAQPEILARRLALTPLRRMGTVDEIAGVVVLLASRAGGFITGQNIVVDGGTLIGDGH